MYWPGIDLTFCVMHYLWLLLFATVCVIVMTVLAELLSCPYKTGLSHNTCCLRPLFKYTDQGNRCLNAGGVLSSHRRGDSVLRGRSQHACRPG